MVRYEFIDYLLLIGMMMMMMTMMMMMMMMKMMPPQAPWSPTAHAFAQHQFSHEVNF